MTTATSERPPSRTKRPPAPVHPRDLPESAIVDHLRHWLVCPPTDGVPAWCRPYAKKCLALGLSMDGYWRRAAVRILLWYPRPLESGPTCGWMGAPAGVRCFVRRMA